MTRLIPPISVRVSIADELSLFTRQRGIQRAWWRISQHYVNFIKDICQNMDLMLIQKPYMIIAQLALMR